MRLKIAAVALVLASIAVSGSPVLASPVITNWTPIYQGIDFASGSDSVAPLQRVQVMRIDLTAPGIHFTTTPSSADQYPGFETFSQTTSDFLLQSHAQVAINANFFSVVSSTPQPENLLGLAISQGQLVSPAEQHYGSLLIRPDNAATIAASPTAQQIADAYNAVSGGAVILQNGTPVNVPSGEPGDPANPNPRTAVGISQDSRYLFLMTLDGRRAGIADGTTQMATGEWLSRFGAYNGLNLDGGGSTAMVRADNRGGFLEMNRPSGNAERLNGNNFAVYASLLPANQGGTYSQTVLNRTPAAYYRLNEPGGATSLADSSGRGHTAAPTDGAGFALGDPDTVINNEPSTSARFTSTTGTTHVTVPFSGGDYNGPSFSVGAWVKIDGSVPDNTFEGVVSNRRDRGSGAAGNAGFILYAGPSTGDTLKHWQFWTGGTTAATWTALGRNNATGFGLGPVVKDNEWQLIFGTFESISGPDANGLYTGTQSLYVDGTLAIQLQNVKYRPNPEAPMFLGAGANEGAGGLPLGGWLDEVMLYDYALSGGDIANLYAAAVPEPATVGSLCLIVAAGFLRRRRK